MIENTDANWLLLLPEEFSGNSAEKTKDFGAQVGLRYSLMVEVRLETQWH
jgi:hypothetical protein